MDEFKFLLKKKTQTHSDSTSHFRCSEFSKDGLLELGGGWVSKTLAIETSGCECGPQTQVKKEVGTVEPSVVFKPRRQRSQAI